MPFLFLVIVPFISSFGKGFGTKCPNLARTVSSKQQATDSCGEDSGRTRRGPLPVPRATIRCGFWFFVGCNQLLRRFWGMNVGCGGILAAPAGGGAPRSESRYNDCRWQSYLCFVPRSGKGGAVGDFWLLPINEPHPLSLALLDSSPTGEPRGKAGVNQAFSSKCMDRDLNRVSITCLAVARMSTWAT